VSEPQPLAAPLPRLVVGPRLRLEAWRRDQVPEVHALVVRSLGSFTAYLPWAHEGITVEEEAAAQLDLERRWEERVTGAWVIIEDGPILGTIGLHRRGGPDEIEIGYLLDDAATGRGVMTEAVRMVTDLAFSVPGIEVVEIVHDRSNTRSEAVPARCGYRRSGSFTSAPQARCETGVKVRWTARRGEWLARGVPSSVVSAT